MDEPQAPPLPFRRSTPPTRPAFLSWVGAGTVGGLVVALVAQELRRAHPPKPWLAEPWELQAIQDATPPAETLDGGVGVEALASVQEVPRVGPFFLALGRPMPKDPLPGQRRPPCKPRGETEINGACWVEVGREEPPCGENMFDYEGRCYYASFNAPKQPTSGEP